MDLTSLTIKKAHQGLLKKEFSAVELSKTYLDEIRAKDKKIFAFLTLNTTGALFQAREVDDMILEKRKIPILAGIPLAVKDNILVEDLKCTAGSKILENYIAPYDATVIKKLKEQKAVILGKTNLDEFAMGSSCENSAFGPTRNPIDLSRVPGGSSGGSAAAVAANMALFSLGSDTGGSIRLPASFCGVVGLKPTYGAVSRYGLIAFASSLDQIGPITKTVEDAEVVFKVIKGKDEMDSTSVKIPEIQNSKTELPFMEAKVKKRTKFSLPVKIQNLRLGVPKEYFVKGIDLKVKKIIEKAIKEVEDLGVKILEISLPHTQYALPAYYIISPSEASANLARYDAIRYGKIKNLTSSKTRNLFDYYLKAREKGFGPEVRRRIMLGTYALSAGYYQAYYLRAQKVRTLIKKDFDKAFQKVDLILTPVSPTPAFKLGEKTADPLAMYLSDVFSAPVNLAGLPALSLPVGRAGKLPVGLQIIGGYFQENKIFKLGQLFEKICKT